MPAKSKLIELMTPRGRSYSKYNQVQDGLGKS